MSCRKSCDRLDVDGIAVVDEDGLTAHGGPHVGPSGGGVGQQIDRHRCYRGAHEWVARPPDVIA
jgi:hypothetical protein